MNPPDALHLHVRLAEQCLEVIEGGRVLARYPVCTARNGAGEAVGSGCTPRGWHRIRACIGAGQPEGAVFVARRPTGEVWTPELARLFPDRDWILTRILWLDGLEPGRNRYGPVGTGRRYIYIHGSPGAALGAGPASHGCVRMTCGDLLDLYPRVSTQTRVLIS